MFKNMDTDPLSLPTAKCTGRGACSRTNKPHIRLVGVHPTKRVAWTKFAEPYPTKWVKSWWKCLDNTIFNKESALLSQLN